MPKYIYNGEEERSFPTLGITVKKGDSFEGPEGLRAPGLSLASSKTAPAVEETKENPKTVFNPDAKDGDKDGFVQDGTPFERPVDSKKQPSAPTDKNAGA